MTPYLLSAASLVALVASYGFLLKKNIQASYYFMLFAVWFILVAIFAQMLSIRTALEAVAAK